MKLEEFNKKLDTIFEIDLSAQLGGYSGTTSSKGGGVTNSTTYLRNRASTQREKDLTRAKKNTEYLNAAKKREKAKESAKKAKDKADQTYTDNIKDIRSKASEA